MEETSLITAESKKIVQDFVFLLEKSKQLFNGLRDLPQYGNAQWQSYFARSFDVYTKLWKFQQENRDTLESVYGLKRWQIGEIASKIGQLYYFYYLKTSETNFLHEALSFYSAIRERGYYNRLNKEAGWEDLMLKKLRYYARYIVICLLLRMMDNVKELTKELKKHVDDYRSMMDESKECPEWSLVLGEVEAFLEADELVPVLDNMSGHITVTSRFTESLLPAPRSPLIGHLTLKDALIVGNCQHQVKFSELTVDMYRMLQTIEREPTLRNGKKDTSCKSLTRANPHKYLLYKPSFPQFTTYLATAIKELPEDGVLLIYLSADSGDPPPNSRGVDMAYDMGGVPTNIKGEDKESKKRSSLLKDPHCIHPGDLYPFTRRPLFLVIESPTSSAFKNFQNLFGQPLVSLMSPSHIPAFLHDETADEGNLFTLFLHSPLTGFCYVTSIEDVEEKLWTDSCHTVNRIIAEIDAQIVKSKTVDVAYMQFFSDDFLRLLILRYCFCYITLRYHRGFKDSTYYPESFPDLCGHDILESPSVHQLILDLAAMLDVKAVFLEPSELE